MKHMHSLLPKLPKRTDVLPRLPALGRAKSLTNALYGKPQGLWGVLRRKGSK